MEVCWDYSSMASGLSITVKRRAVTILYSNGPHIRDTEATYNLELLVPPCVGLMSLFLRDPSLSDITGKGVSILYLKGASGCSADLRILRVASRILGCIALR